MIEDVFDSYVSDATFYHLQSGQFVQFLQVKNALISNFIHISNVTQSYLNLNPKVKAVCPSLCILPPQHQSHTHTEIES